MRPPLLLHEKHTGQGMTCNEPYPPGSICGAGLFSSFQVFDIISTAVQETVQKTTVFDERRADWQDLHRLIRKLAERRSSTIRRRFMEVEKCILEAEMERGS